MVPRRWDIKQEMGYSFPLYKYVQLNCHSLGGVPHVCCESVYYYSGLGL